MIIYSTTNFTRAYKESVRSRRINRVKIPLGEATMIRADFMEKQSVARTGRNNSNIHFMPGNLMAVRLFAEFCHNLSNSTMHFQAHLYSIWWN